MSHGAPNHVNLAKPSELRALTGLRGVGSLWVFFHHINLFSYGTNKGLHLLAIGYVGVDLFFLLSGFVMCASKWRALAAPDLRAYRRFVAERITRIYPANAAVLVLFAAVASLYPAVWDNTAPYLSSPTSFASNLLLLQFWVPLPLGAWNQPSWSVSAEIGAYLALPALLACLRPIRQSKLALAAAAVLLALVLILLAVGAPDLNVKVRGGLLRLVFEFTAGGCLFAAWRAGLRLPTWPATLLTILLLAGAILLPQAGANFLFLPAFALLVLLCAQDQNPLATLLASRPAVAFGRISYSLYLVHWPVLMIWFRATTGLPGAAHSLPSPPALAALTTITLLLAIVIHLAVEAPSHRLARRITQAGRQSAPPVLATAPGV